MPDFVADAPYQTPQSAWGDWYGHMPVSRLQGLTAQFHEAAPLDPTSKQSLTGFIEQAQYEEGAGGLFGRALAAAGAEAQGISPEDIGLDRSLAAIPAPKITAEEARKRYPEAAEAFKGREDFPEPVAAMIAERHKVQSEREDVLRRYEEQYSWPTKFATGTIAFMMDPLNAAASVVPGVGEEALMARLGAGAVGRTLARVGAGASAGAAGQVPLSAIRAGIANFDDSDYGLRDAFRDLFYGAAGGAILHAGVFGGLREAGILKPDRMIREARTELPGMAPVPEPEGPEIVRGEHVRRPEGMSDEEAQRLGYAARIAEPSKIEAEQVRAAEPAATAGRLGTDAERAEVQGLIDAKASPEEIAKHPFIERVQRENESRPQTKDASGYGTPEYEANRRFVVDGQEVTGYTAAVDKLAERARSYSTAGPVEQGRQAILVLGPPASGKSRLSEALAAARRAAIPDPDDAKLTMPEYDGGQGTQAVHEESAELWQRVLFDKLIPNGDNLVIPRVGGSIETMRALIEGLKKEGYTVDLVNMSVDPAEAYRRMVRRFLKTGRIVGSDYFDKIDGNPTKNYYVLKAEGGIRESADVNGNVPAGELAFNEGADTSLARDLRLGGGREPGLGEGPSSIGGTTTARFGDQWRVAQTILGAPAHVQADAVKTAVSQVLDGKPVEVDPIIKAAEGPPREDTGGPIGPGEEIMVLRLGSAEGGLPGRNGGNARSVADHLVRITGEEGPVPRGGTGDTISVYGVKFEYGAEQGRGFGEYAPMVGGIEIQGAEPVFVGRRIREGAVSYSFPSHGQGYEPRLIARIPLDEVRASLRMRGFASPDDAGINATEAAIREVVRIHAEATQAPVNLAEIARAESDLYRDGFAQGIPQAELAEVTERIYGERPTEAEEEVGGAPARPAETPAVAPRTPEQEAALRRLESGEGITTEELRAVGLDPWGRRLAIPEAQPPAVPAEGREAGGVPGVMIETGGIVRTKSGRETAPAPRIDMTTERKATASLGRMDQWLLSEAKKEAEGNDYVSTLLDGVNPKRMSTADRDMLNEILFGEPTEKPPEILRPLAPPAPVIPSEPVAPAAIPSEVPNTVHSFSPDELIIDAKRFQFKEGGDEAGVTDRLKGVTTWDPIKAGMVLAWEDETGRRFLVDGHQRMGLAKRIAEADPNQRPMLNGWLLRAADGVSDIEARTIAASKNIAEGTGTAVDAAKVLRDKPELIKELPPRLELVRQARGLVNLSDEAFRMVVNDVVPANYAAIVGRLSSDPKMQESLLGLLAKTEPANVVQAEAIVRQGIEAGAHVETQIGLFGAEDVATNLYLDRAKVLDRALRQLKRDRTIFSTIVKESDILQSVGNVLAADMNVKRATADAQAVQVLQTLASRKGPISDALGAAAKRARDDGNTAGAVREFVAAIRREAEGGNLARLADGLERGDEHAGDEGAASRVERSAPATDRAGSPVGEQEATEEVHRVAAAGRRGDWTISTEVGAAPLFAGLETKAEPGAEGRPQLILPGGERSAVQLAAAREAQGRGMIRPEVAQREAGGMFAPPEPELPDLFARGPQTPIERQLVEAERAVAEKGGVIHPDDRAALADADAAMRIAEAHEQAYAQAAECLIEAGV